jgi:hypothetical protein
LEEKLIFQEIRITTELSQQPPYFWFYDGKLISRPFICFDISGLLIGTRLGTRPPPCPNARTHSGKVAAFFVIQPRGCFQRYE